MTDKPNPLFDRFREFKCSKCKTKLMLQDKGFIDSRVNKLYCSKCFDEIIMKVNHNPKISDHETTNNP